VRIASDLLLPEVGKAGTHDVAQRIVDEVEHWCAQALRSDSAP
jgi:hypothetical protein